MHPSSILRYSSLIIVLFPGRELFAQADTPDFEFPVTLEHALDLAISRDPEFRRLELVAEAASGQVEQASLRPNPVVGAEVENFLGTGSRSGISGLEVTLGISQLIETAEKRQRRTELAEREKALVPWDAEERMATLEAEVRQAFAAVLLAQNSVELEGELLTLAKRSLQETARLVDAARAPEIERSRAELAVQRQIFAVRRAERGLETAKGALAAIWGLLPVPAFTVAGTVRIETPPDLMQLVSALSKTAALARFTSETEMREAALKLERARATPDIEVSAGARYFNDSDGEAAFIVGVQVPWPLTNKNQGNIRSARAHLRAVEHEREVVRRQLLQSLATAHRILVNTFEEARSLEEDLRPAAERTLSDTEAGYQRGQFNILSVLESRRALFEIRQAHLDAMQRYATARAQIEALTRPATLQ